VDLRFDHVVIASRTLDEGVEWVERRLGVVLGSGGKHDVMGTHNRLLSLGPGRFVEVIAIDPEAPAPLQPRWFELDTPAMRQRLEDGPALIHWVVRSSDIEAALDAAGGARPEVLALSRGAFRWKIGVPADGRLEQSGVMPTIIQWFAQHPSDVLADSGCRLESLVLHHPDASAILHRLRYAGLSIEDPVQPSQEGAGLEVRIRTPRGVVEIRE
jgi:catechol 2,3-dioxygenase-like lactoylglutathione lyase family enzyme